MPFGTPFGTRFGTRFGTHSGTPFGTHSGTPFGTPFGTRFGTAGTHANGRLILGVGVPGDDVRARSMLPRPGTIQISSLRVPARSIVTSPGGCTSPHERRKQLLQEISSRLWCSC
jgi:hypothetical protein